MLRAGSKTEVLNTYPWELSPEYQPDGCLSSEKAKEMISIAAKQGSHCFEWAHKRMDGEVFSVEVLLTLVTIEGKKMFNSTWRELTEKKRAKKELDEYHRHLEKLVKDKTKEISMELEKHKRLENDIRQILDASSDGIRVIDTDYNIIYASKPFTELQRHSKNITGKKCYKVLSEDECHTEQCSLKRVIKTGKKFAREKKFKSEDGKEAVYHIDIIPYKDARGNITGIIKNYRNITEERQTEKRLEEEIRKHKALEKEYRTLFESSQDAIMTLNRKGFVDCNKATFRLFGISSKKQFVRKTPWDFSPPKQPDGVDSLTAAREHIEKACREGSDFFEWTHNRHDGTIFSAEVLLSRVEYQDNTVQATVRDITERKLAEKKLKELAEEYHMLFESSRDAISLFYENRIYDCNNAAIALLGYSSKEELIGKSPTDITTPKQADGQDSAAAAKEHSAKALREGSAFFEWMGVRKDGTVFPSEVMLSRMEYQGRPVLLSVVRDITEHKQAEKKLEELAGEYRVLFEASGDAIMMQDRERFFDCNQATLKLFGFSSKKQFIRKIPAELSAPKQLDGRYSATVAKEHIEKAYREGMDFFEWLSMRQDGAQFLSEVKLSRMEYQGRTVLQVTVRDITERKQAEKKLEELAEKYRVLFEYSGDAIGMFDKEKFLDCNKKTLELFGFSSKEELIKIGPADVAAPIQPGGKDAVTEAREHMERACREGTDCYEWLCRRKDGSTFPSEIMLNRMEYQGRVVLLAVLRDITARKQAEEELANAHKIAEENAQQQGRIEMANNILHDIGNAMTGIGIYVLKPQTERKWREIQSLSQLNELFNNSQEEMSKALGKEKQQALNNFIQALISSLEERNAEYVEFLEKMSASVGHICSVLDLQRHYLNEKSPLLTSKINLGTIINDTLIMMASSLRKRDIHVNLDTGDRIIWISGDQTRMIRVFLNIVKNVCEAFDEVKSRDNRTLEVSIVPDEEKKEVKIIFLDNAVGFSPEIGKKLFERGFTSKPNGSGIGLHECCSIVESHGGTMTMESEGVNTGALTVITFPILK